MITNNLEDLLNNYGLQVQEETITLSKSEIDLILQEEWEAL